MVPPAEELLAVLPGLGLGSDGDELLRTYALINPECTHFVFEYLKQAVQDAVEGNDERSAVAATKVLAARVADSLQAEKTERVATVLRLTDPVGRTRVGLHDAHQDAC